VLKKGIRERPTVILVLKVAFDRPTTSGCALTMRKRAKIANGNKRRVSVRLCAACPALRGRCDMLLHVCTHISAFA
jgi:hypothetical protein